MDCLQMRFRFSKNKKIRLRFFLNTDMEDGALLPSPTRDKLMPTIPKSKEDDSYSSQRGSPKKSNVSRHGSPQKGSPQKQSMQKKAIKQGDHRNSLKFGNIFFFKFNFIRLSLQAIDPNPLVQYRQMLRVRRSGKFDRAVLHRLLVVEKLQRKLRYQRPQYQNDVHGQVSYIARQ